MTARNKNQNTENKTEGGYPWTCILYTKIWGIFGLIFNLVLRDRSQNGLDLFFWKAIFEWSKCVRMNLLSQFHSTCVHFAEKALLEFARKIVLYQRKWNEKYEPPFFLLSSYQRIDREAFL